MIHSILVPTDFSKSAMKAVLYAAEIAKKNKCLILLLHVIEPVEHNIREAFPLHEKYLKEVAHARKEELESKRTSIADKYPDLKIETALANGTIIRSVLDFADRHGVDLIVMGTKGATGLKEIFIGSVVAGTIGRTKIPILAIPDEYVFEVPDAVLFATKHFEENTDLLNMVIEIASLFSAVVHVAVFVDKENADDFTNKAVRLNHYMEFIGDKYPGIRFKGEVIEGKVFEETVEKYDKQNEVDIIAMITYPKSFWESFIKKSMTKKMAFHSKIPVLAIPAK